MGGRSQLMTYPLNTPVLPLLSFFKIFRRDLILDGVKDVIGSDHPIHGNYFLMINGGFFVRTKKITNVILL